jgi:two-component system, OmpR family, response regulator
MQLDEKVHASLQNMLVLVVEDDPQIAKSIRQELKRAGHDAQWAPDGETGLDLASKVNYDAAIVDLMLPRMDGLTLIERMRANSVKAPVIVLSAKRSTDDKVACLQRGADDYVSKPFDLPELLARLEAVLRRSQEKPEVERIEAAGVVLDLVSRSVRRDGVRIELPPREFALLEVLMRNKGRPLSKSYLIERLWEYQFTPQTNLVDVLVCRLRNNIDREHPVKLIHTVRGIGYVFRAA